MVFRFENTAALEPVKRLENRRVHEVRGRAIAFLIQWTFGPGIPVSAAGALPASSRLVAT